MNARFDNFKLEDVEKIHEIWLLYKQKYPNCKERRKHFLKYLDTLPKEVVDDFKINTKSTG